MGHPELFSEITRPLARAARHIAAGRSVLHVASHSFTPVLDEAVRRADVACLYDPRRPADSALAGRWLAVFARRATGLRLRRNYPYQGHGDGLAALLRKRFPNAAYTGIELEVNQSFVARGGAPWVRLRCALIDALADARTAAREQAPP